MSSPGEELLECQGLQVKCQACDQENPAISRCMDCEHFLCQECQKAHQRMKLMKTHKIMKLAVPQTQRKPKRGTLQADVPECEKHPLQPLSIYCNTCEQLVCTTCSVLEHGTHYRCGLAKALVECKQAITKLTAQVRENLKEVGNATAEIDRAQKQLDALFAAINNKISRKADQMVIKIREDERQLKQEVEIFYKEKVKTFETVQKTKSKEVWEAEHKLRQVDQHMSEATSYDMLRLKQKHLQTLTALEQTTKECKTIPESLFNHADFEERVRSLGRPVLQTQPELEMNAEAEEDKPLRPARLEQEPQRPQSLLLKDTPPVPRRSPSEEKPRPVSFPLATEPQRLPELLQQEEPHQSETLPPKVVWHLKIKLKKFGSARTDFKCIQDVAAFANNEIVLVDVKHKQLMKILPIHEPQSRVITEKLHIKGLIDQYTRVAVNKMDQLIVLLGSVVKTFDREYQFVRQFIPGSPGSEDIPTCLAVDRNNLIAVGFADKQVISLHNPNGALIKTLAAPLIGAYLTICKQLFVYINKNRKKIISVDYNGTGVFSVGVINPMDVGACGVCPCDDGSFYFANQGFTAADIFHCSSDSKNCTRVISGCGHPRGIALTEAGELVVAAEQSVRIYQRTTQASK